MPSITLTLEPEKAARVNAAIQGIWPIPQIPDPEHVGDPEDAPPIDEFTPAEAVEGTQPEAACTIICSNQTTPGVEIAPNWTAAP